MGFSVDIMDVHKLSDRIVKTGVSVWVDELMDASYVVQ
jgi:hypothetical protein